MATLPQENVALELSHCRRHSSICKHGLQPRR